MWKKVVTAAVIIIGTLSNSAGVFAAEHLPNGDMSIVGANGDPSGWTRSGYGDNSRNWTFPVSGLVRTKLIVARTDIANYQSGEVKWVSPAFPVVAGHAYTWSHFYRSVGESKLIVRFLVNGAYQYQWLNTLPVSTSLASRRIQRTFIAPAGATSATIWHSLAGNGFVEIGESTVTDEVTTQPKTNILKNSTLEELDKNNEPRFWNHLATGGAKGKYGLRGCLKNDATNLADLEECNNGWDILTLENLMPSGVVSWYSDPATLYPNPKALTVIFNAASLSPLQARVIFTLSNGTHVTSAAFNANPVAGKEWAHYDTKFTVPAGAVSASLWITKKSDTAYKTPTRLAGFAIWQDEPAHEE